jgi:hypothetical protein
MTAADPPGPRPVRALRGPVLSCKGWPHEAAMRMLMNNLDPEVAEQPDQLIVYDGSGRTARSWSAYDAIVRTLQGLEGDETLLVQSGMPISRRPLARRCCQVCVGAVVGYRDVQGVGLVGEGDAGRVGHWHGVRRWSGPPARSGSRPGPGSPAQVHARPCGEVLEYGAPGTGQEWHCGSGHSWARAGGRLAGPSSGAHILQPGDVR